MVMNLSMLSPPREHRFESLHDDEEIDELDEDFEIDDELPDGRVPVDQNRVWQQPAKETDRAALETKRRLPMHQRSPTALRRASTGA
jgi:hypothetical protein